MTWLVPNLFEGKGDGNGDKKEKEKEKPVSKVNKWVLHKNKLENSHVVVHRTIIKCLTLIRMIIIKVSEAFPGNFIA